MSRILHVFVACRRKLRVTVHMAVSSLCYLFHSITLLDTLDTQGVAVWA